jgi:DNA-binding transcriptional MerR regulator/DNA gyrase inhibitor GyrI
MNRSVAINKLSEQLGLTSRTLRHWESEGLFKSTRDASSGWRMYDENALLCIRITALLRKMDISIRDIKSVIENQSISQLSIVVGNKISELQVQKNGLSHFQKQLEQVQSFLQNQDSFSNLDELLKKTEALFMQSSNESSMVKIVTLPPMRVAYNIAVSVSPEDDAMPPVLEWIKSSHLLSTARFFGGNVKPMPSSPGKPYGYGMCVTIPDGVSVPPHLKEMVLPGGLYAMFESSEDIPLSWNTFMKSLASNGAYQSDRSRLCLEEHIRNDKPSGCGNEYHLILLEPVEAIKK